MSLAVELLGEPQPAATTTALVSPAALWRYRDNGVTPPSTWRSRSYDASTWRQGRGQFGAGDGDETTVINRTNPAHVTDWYRVWFPVPNRTAYRWVTLRLLADDGAIVSVNGTEVARDNMPAGAVSPMTPGLVGPVTGAAEATWRSFPIPRSLLVDGSNLIAVEVHTVGAWRPGHQFRGTGRRRGLTGSGHLRCVAMYQWSDEHQMMRDAVRRFVEKEIVPNIEELEHGDTPPYDVLRKMFADLRHGRHGPRALREADRAAGARRRLPPSRVPRPAAGRRRRRGHDDDPDHRALPLLPGHGHRDGRQRRA